MLSIPEILTSRNLSPAERRRYRLSITIAAGVAVLAGIVCGAQQAGKESGDASSGFDGFNKNYGCTTTDIPAGLGAVAAALAAREPLGLGTEMPNVDAAITAAGQTAQREYAAQHNGAGPQPGADVETCVSYDPLHFGNGGWQASVTIQG